MDMSHRRYRRQKAITNQINRLAHRILKMNALSRRFSWCRLLIFLIGGVLVLISAFWISEKLAWLFFTAAFFTFGIIAFYHHRLREGIRRHQIWMEIKKSQGAQMDLDWKKIPGSILQLPLSDLPFEKDLDIIFPFILLVYLSLF